MEGSTRERWQASKVRYNPPDGDGWRAISSLYMGSFRFNSWAAQARHANPHCNWKLGGAVVQFALLSQFLHPAARAALDAIRKIVSLPLFSVTYLVLSINRSSVQGAALQPLEFGPCPLCPRPPKVGGWVRPFGRYFRCSFASAIRLPRPYFASCTASIGICLYAGLQHP